MYKSGFRALGSDIVVNELVELLPKERLNIGPMFRADPEALRVSSIDDALSDPEPSAMGRSEMCRAC